HLGRGLKPLYTIHGEETLLALEAADRLRKRCHDDGYVEREVLTVESGFDWSQLKMSGNSLSLFGAKRLLEIRIPSGKPGNEGAQALRDYADDLPPDTVTLVQLPKLDRTQLASGWMEALDAAGVIVAAMPVGLSRLPQWLGTRLAHQRQQADQQTLDFLVSRVEGNLLAAHQELQKLALLFPPGKLELAQVEEAVLDVARYDVFKLGEALLSADGPRFVRMLEGLRGEGVAPALILWAITEEVRALLYVRAGQDQGRPVQQLMREARVWGPRAELLPRALRRFSISQLEDAIVHAANVDRMIKGLVKGDVWDELLQLGMRVLHSGKYAANRDTIAG
ncbi:MAG: DNA polymerase III subunit delta, partial [Proteobacteria bacterium]